MCIGRTFGTNITEGAHSNSLWRIYNHSLALTARSSVLSLLERRVSWGNYENSKAVSINLGVGRFWIGTESLVLGDSASGNFQFAGTVPPKVYTTGRETEDGLCLRTKLVNPWCNSMSAPRDGVNTMCIKKGFLCSMGEGGAGESVKGGAWHCDSEREGNWMRWQ